MTLTEFLLARVAEDEAVARMRIQNGEPKHAPVPWGCPSATRVLAECEAKRSAVDAAWDDHGRIEGEWGMCQSREQMDAKGDVPAVVAHLAAVYADHPDWREEWRP